MIPDTLRRKINGNINIKYLFTLLDRAIDLGMRFRRNSNENIPYRKKSDNLTDYQYERSDINNYSENDRQFPLETVMLQSYNLNHDTKLNKANIHTGALANNFALFFNAMAVTIGRDIFFRNGAYKPETEEGRKILAHELTHIAQYEENRLPVRETVKELEYEAEIEEMKEVYDDDPIQGMEIGGEIFYVRPSQHNKIVHDAIEMTKRWFEEQKTLLDEKDYYKFLLKYKRWKERQ